MGRFRQQIPTENVIFSVDENVFFSVDETSLRDTFAHNRAI